MLSSIWKSISIAQQPKKQIKRKVKPKQELLPNQISGKILDLQIEMQREDFSKQLVSQLLSAYAEAVEFYEERGNEKYKLYQKRMKDFLQKPVIYSMLQGQSDLNPIKRSEAHNKEFQRANYRVQEQVNKLIANTAEKANKQKAKIDESLQQQQLSLKQRMKKRKIISNQSIQSESQLNQQSSRKQKMDISLIIGGLTSRVVKRKIII